MTPWLIAALVVVVAHLILWAATTVDRERAARPHKPGIRINSMFSGPVGTGIYKLIDDRRHAGTEDGDEK